MMKMMSANVTESLRKKFGIQNETARAFMAEFFGTFLLVCFGNGAVAQKVLTADGVNDYFSVVWGYSLGVMLGVIASGNISGGHLNPAVTLAMALWGRLAWPKVPVYMVAQYFGAFSASVVVYGVYISALNSYEDIRSLSTAGIWATYPGSMVAINGTTIHRFLTSSNGIGDQVLGTMLLLICICAIVDKKNMNIPGWISPLFVGFTVMNIGLSFGFNCGFAINPARDLAPRIFTLVAGWGDLPFTATTVDGVTWWWIPILAPHVGAVLGMLFYTMFIEMHHPDESEVMSIGKQNHEVHSNPINYIHMEPYIPGALNESKDDFGLTGISGGITEITPVTGVTGSTGFTGITGPRKNTGIRKESVAIEE